MQRLFAVNLNSIRLSRILRESSALKTMPGEMNELHSWLSLLIRPNQALN
jgi:hypothetical protein